MSEKYSMNELLAWIEKQCSLVDGEWGCATSCENECRGPKDAIIARLRAADVISKNYDELLFEVARIFPGETRHETARRYIREAESRTNGAAKAIAEYEGKEE